MPDRSAEFIDYAALLPIGGDLASVIGLLSEELPCLWQDQYVVSTGRLTRILRIRVGTLEYLYDNLATLEALGEVPVSPIAEARLVGVFGTSASAPQERSRDHRRLRAFIGSTGAEFGMGWDKGQFVNHELGGRVSGTEFNVFIQRRDLDRGWSSEGKVYRAMARYCHVNPGTFFFSRPFYADETSKPSFIEFGVLKGPANLWVQLFDNRGRTIRDLTPNSSCLDSPVK